MKVRDLIKLLESKPQNLPVYIQDFVGSPIDGRRIIMHSLFEDEIAVMKNVNTTYLAIGYTCDGVADADGSEIVKIG